MKILRKFYTSMLLAACLTGGAQALPEGANVVHGNVQINNSGSTQTIVQGSNQAIINWNGFNIDVGELVQFIQPSSISAILNRVVGQDPSMILGALKANGQVFLVNPNGVIFGDGARVDVGSLVVSTLNITDDNFLKGNYTFEQATDKELASVINHGTIKIDDNGFLVLTGPMVANEGVILARVGQVALAGGTKSTVSFDPTGMIQVELPAGSQSNDGIVSLSTSDTSDLLSSLVAGPSSKAGRIVTRDGRTFLEVASGTVVNTGEIRAEGTDGEGGGRIVLGSTAHTLLADGSVLSAAGQGVDSSGGEVYVLSGDEAVSAAGSLIDVSGGRSGDAGFAEQSGRSGRVAATVDLSAQDGKAGTFLIDPGRLVVQTGDGMGSPDPSPNMAITEDTIEGVASGTVLLQAQNGVDFEPFFDGQLILQNNVNLTIDLTTVGGDGSDAITFSSPGESIVLNGTGAFRLTSATGTNVNDLNVITADGDINVDLGNGKFNGFNTFSSTNGSATFTNAGVALDTGSVSVALSGPGTASFSSNDNEVSDLSILTDTGAITLDMGLGGVLRNANSLTSNTGMVTATAQSEVGPTNPGRLIIHTLGDANVTSTGSLRIQDTNVDTFTGIGQSFLVDGDNLASTAFNLNITGDASGDPARFGGQLDAASVSVTADSIGASGILEFDTSNLTLVAPNGISADFRPAPTRTNNTITVTHLSNSFPASLAFFSEGTIVSDDGTNLSLDGTDLVSLTYNTIGNRAIDAHDDSGDNLNFNTDGAVTGTAAIDGIFTVTAGSVDLTGTAVLMPFLGNYYDLTANTGDVAFDFSDTDFATVTAHSLTGSVTVSSLGDLDVDLTAANTVDVTATDIYGTFDAPVLNATATDFGVDLTQTGTTNVSAHLDGAGGTGGVFLTTNGAVDSRGISGSYVGINVNGAGNGVTNSSGRIVAPEMSIQAPGNIDVATTTGILTVNSMGNVTVDNRTAALDPLSADIRTSPTGDISLTTVGLIVDFPPGEVMPPPPSYFEGNSVTLNAVGIDADVNANAVNATATGGPIDLALLGPDTLVNAAASGGAAPVTVASMGNISAGNIQGDFVDLSTAGTGTVTSANATDRVLANGTLHVMSGGAVDLLTTSNRIDIFAFGSVDIDNQSIGMTPLTATIRALGPSDINLTTDNAIGSFDPFPIQGPIVDSVFTANTVNITATDIDAQFFAAAVNATATAGDAKMLLGNGTTDLSASAANGSVMVDTNFDVNVVAPGITAGNQVYISALTEGPTTIAGTTGVIDAPTTVILEAENIDVDLGSSVTDLQTFSFADTIIDANSAAVSFTSQANNLTINNAAGSLSGSATVNDASTVTLTGSDINASVTGVDSLTVNAAAGAGNVVLNTSASLSTIHANASGNVETTTGNMNTLGGNITGSMVTLHASSVDQTTVDSPDLVLDITGSTAVVDLLAATTSVTGTVLNDFTLSSADSNIAIGSAGLSSTNLGTANFNAPKGSVVSTSAVPGESVVDVSAAVVNSDSANLKFGPNLVSLNGTTVGDATYSAGSSSLAVSGSSGGAFNVTNTGDIDATAPVNSVTGITAGSAKLTGANVNAQVTAASVDAQATVGTATLDLLADTSVTGSSVGLFQITANSNLGIGAAGLSSDLMVDIAAPNGNLTGPGTIDAPSVQLAAQDIDVDLGANTASVNADSSVGNVVLRGHSTTLDVTSTAPSPDGDVTVSNTGSLTTGPSGIIGDVVTLSGADVTADVVANTVLATSTVGDVNLQTSFVPVSVGGSAAGSFSATTSGQNLTVDPGNIVANTSVSLSTGGGGTITGSGVVDAPSVTLLGSSVDVNLGTSVLGVNSNTSGDTTLHSDSAFFTGTGSTGPGSTYSVTAGLGGINSDLSGVTTDHLVLDSATTISSTVNSSILTLDATSNGMTAITTDTSGFTVTGTTGTGNLFSMLTTGGDITSDFTGLTTDFLQLDSAAGINSSATAPNVNAVAANGDIVLALQAPSTTVDSTNNTAAGKVTVNSTGDVVVGTFSGIQALGSVSVNNPTGSLSGSGVVNAPSVVLNSDSIDVNLGVNVDSVDTTSIGNTTLRTDNPPTTATGSTGSGATYSFTANSGALNTDFSGVTTDSLVLVSPSTIDTTVNSAIGALNTTSNGDTTIHATSAAFPVSGTTGTGNTFTMMTTVGDITSDFTGLATDFLVLDSAAGINSSVAAPSVNATAQNGDITLGLQAASTTVDATANAAGGDITLNSSGDIVVGTTTGLSAGQSVTVNNPAGSLSGSGTIDAPTVLLNSNTITAILGSNVADLTTTSTNGTTLTGNSANINLTATTGPFGTFSFINNAGAIDADLTNVMSNSISLTATDIMATLSAATVDATATNGDVLLNLLGADTSVTASATAAGGDITVNSAGNIGIGNAGLVANQSVTVTNATGSLTSAGGPIDAPTVSLNSDSIDLDLGPTVSSISSTSTGNTTLRTTSAPTTATGSTGAGSTYSFTANSGALNTDFSGVTTDNLVLASVSTIDTTVNSSIGTLNTTSNGDTTIHATSAAFPVSGTTGTGNTFTMMTTVGDITSDFTGLATDFLVLDSAAGINSSVAAPSVNATAQNGDITLGLQAASTTVDATANAAGGDITLNSSGDIVVGTTTGLSAGQSVTVNNPAGSLSGSGTIDAPTVLLNSDTITAILGSNVANLTTTSVGNTSITGNSANLTLTATTGAGGTFALINNAGAIDADLTNVMSNSISLTATDIMATLSAATVDATATNGDVLLNLLASSTTVNASASAAGGDVTVNSSGDIVVGPGTGIVANQSVSLSNVGHNISGTGTVDAPTITVNSGDVALNTGSNTSSLALNLSGTGNVHASSANLAVSGSSGSGQTVSVNNQGGNINTNFFVSDGALNFTASGDLTGSAGASTLNLQGSNVNMAVGGGDVNANATSGDVTLSGSATTLQGSASGLFSATLGGDFGVGNVTANQINLESSAAGRQGAMAGAVTSLNGTKLAASTVTVTGDTVNVDTEAQTIQATGTNGVTVRNTGTIVNSANLQAPSGNVNFTTTSHAFNVSSQGLNSTLSAGGALTGSVDSQFSTTVSGSLVNLTSLSSQGLNLTTTSGDATVQATPKSNFFEVSANVAGALDLVTTTGDIILYGVNAGGAANLTAQNGAIVHNVEAPGLLTAGSANLNAKNDIVLNVDTPSVRATSSAGKVDITSVGTTPITVAGSASGDFSVGASSDIVHQDVSGANITLDAGATHDISRDTTAGLTPAARLTTPGKVTLTGNNVTAETDAGSIQATATNDATIDNFSATVNPVAIDAGHDASFTSVGTANISQLNSSNNLTLDVGQAVTGSFQGNKVTLAGTSVSANVQANELTATARAGDATITSNSTSKLTLTDSTASGNFSLTHKGDVEFNRIEAQNVNISTTGNITDTANTIVASGITLNGNNVFVNTQGQVIVITAQGDVTITNKIVDVNALTIDAQGSVDFGTEGNLHISNVAGGPLAKLTAGGSITADTNALVKAAKIQLAAGGNITPDTSNALNLQATDSIEVTAHVVNLQAQGSSVDPTIAAALNGNLAASAVTIGQGSGPIYYNGVLLNGAPAPTPPPTPGVSPGDAGNQIGQQNGQVIDDGSVGSAANDGLVEQSPTQKLVAQLTEQANGSGDGTPTSALITLEVDALGELEVKLQTPSPQDEKIDNSDSMSADDVLDLDTDELSDVKVALYYDPATDQLILAVDLRADDILDLDVSNFQEIPINLNYSFLSDPKLCLEKLRANDLIDLEVEDLGEIPIKVHVEGDDRSASE